MERQKPERQEINELRKYMRSEEFIRKQKALEEEILL